MDAGMSALVISTSSSRRRVRFSKLPPSTSVRVLEAGERNALRR
jgi:hypothetical protein